MATPAVCKIDGCGKAVKSRAMCPSHYDRWLRKESEKSQLLRQSPGRGMCSLAGCDRVGKLTRGWCDMHYQRWRKIGDPGRTKINRDQTGKPCAAKGCKKSSGYHGYCQAHYRRLKLYGSVEAFHPNYHHGETFIRAHLQYDGDDCLRWPYSVNKNGRGMAVIGNVQMSAPRAMCTLAHGQPPTPEHEAAHSCGKGHEGCINPRHLRWATTAENRADMVAHGTVVRGEKVNTALLTQADVRAIRASSETVAALSDRYAVSKHCIWDVRKRRSWAWLE